MTEDKLGKFLFESEVPPDDFSYFRERIHGDDIAVIETNHARIFPMTDDRGQMIRKLIPDIVRLSLLRSNFSVRFIDGEAPRETAFYNELDDDPNQLELIRVEYHELEIEEDDEEEDAVTALFYGQDYCDDPRSIPIFYSYDGLLLTSHPKSSDDPAQPSLFE